MDPIIRAKYAFALQEGKLSFLGKKRMNKQSVMRNVNQSFVKCSRSLVTFFSLCGSLTRGTAYCGALKGMGFLVLN